MLLSDQKGISDRQKSAAEYQRWLKYSFTYLQTREPSPTRSPDLNVQAPAAPHPQDLGITEYPEMERVNKSKSLDISDSWNIFPYVSPLVSFVLNLVSYLHPSAHP